MKLTQMRRASNKMDLQWPRPAATSTVTCLYLPPDRSSLALEPIASRRTHHPPHSNPHSRVHGAFRAPSPAGSFLGGFRTTALVLAAPSRWAVIRNPTHKRLSKIARDEAGIRPFGFIFRYSPRSMPKAVVLSNAKHCPISPVGPKPGSSAAWQFQAHSACWR